MGPDVDAAGHQQEGPGPASPPGSMMQQVSKPEDALEDVLGEEQAPSVPRITRNGTRFIKPSRLWREPMRQACQAYWPRTRPHQRVNSWGENGTSSSKPRESAPGNLWSSVDTAGVRSSNSATGGVVLSTAVSISSCTPFAAGRALLRGLNSNGGRTSPPVPRRRSCIGPRPRARTTLCTHPPCSCGAARFPLGFRSSGSVRATCSRPKARIHEVRHRRRRLQRGGDRELTLECDLRGERW